MNLKSTMTSRRSFGIRASAFPLRAALSQVLVLLLIFQACVLPSAIIAAPAARNGTALLPVVEDVATASENSEMREAAGEKLAVATAQSFGIVLTPLATEFQDHASADHHQPAGQLVLSANVPAGQPHNFELIAADGSHAAFSNVAGLTGDQRIATARDDGQDQSLAGFAPGELFAGTGAPGVIARISADGSAVQNPWVTLPGESSVVDGGLYVDRTGAFGGDLLAVTSAGGVWRVNAAGQPTLLASLGISLRGVTTIPEDPDRHGPWAGKVLVGAPAQGIIYSIDLQGNNLPYQIGINPEDIRVVPAHENFYGVDPVGRKLWGAPAAAFAGMTGDVLVAQKSPGTLARVHWDGAEFQVSQIAEVAEWRQVTFSPAGVAPIEAVRRVHDKIAVVRHAPTINSGRVEGALWQLTGEPVTLDGNDTITSDLLVPGTPNVSIYDTGGKHSFGGIIEGQDSAEPSGYNISLTGNATLRHLITRTDPIELDPIAPPPAPAGTRDVSLNQAGQSAGDWATLRNLTLSGRAGAVTVPPGTYGAFSASSQTSLVFGIAGATERAVYNLDSLSLSGGSQLRLAGPVVLTVKNGVTLSGSTLGAGEDPQRMLLKMPGGELKITGSGVLYGVVRAPQSAVSIEGNGRLRGTVSCDHLTVSGNGVLQITENDLPPPPVNRPPDVEAGGDQTITLPVDTAALQGTATDDGLPQDSTLAFNWSKLSGPAAVTFDSPHTLATNVTFTQPGTYVLRLTASDSLLTASDELTITVIPRNQSPSVEAGAEQIITLPADATLSGIVSDDGLPRGVVLSVAWSVVEGPGAVIFANPSSATTSATFSVAGRYTLRLTANDTEFTVSDDTVVEVRSANLPPVVSAGPDQMITPPNNTIRLNGTVSDDGRPSTSALTVNWTQVSGPVEVAFGDAASAVTTATFNDQGTYVLRLTATDTEFTVSDEVEVVVGCPDNLKNLDVVLVIDRSGSMAGQRLIDAKTAAKSFIDNLQLATDQISIVSFSSGGQLNQPLTHDGARAKAAVDSIFASGGTNIGSGITVAKNELTSARHSPNSAPIIILLSDGENTDGDFNAPANAAKDAGIRIITIGVAGAAPAQMRSIASSPTDFYFAPTSEDLKWIYAVIAGSVCRNTPPLARAGTDFEVFLPNTATLNGEAHDDGLPANSRLTSTWSVVSGPAPVNIFDVNAPGTNAVFSAPGTYVLRLTATDSSLSTSDEVTVVVHPEPSLEGASLALATNNPPTNVIGRTATLSARLLNGSGQPITNFGVSFAVSGANAATGTGITDATGAATFTYTGTNIGTDTMQAVAQSSKGAVSSNAVTLDWAVESPDPQPSPGVPPVPSTTQGWIGGPAHQSVVTGIVPVTLGANVTLAQGTVEYCTMATPSVCTMLNGAAQGAPGSTVANFDTTVVPNGSYIIRLQGTNDAGAQLLSLILVTVAGENKPGRMTLSITDMTVPVGGLPITIGRTYDSLERNRVGDFGFGWTLSVGSPRLEVNPAKDVTITEPGTGRRVSFKFAPRSFSFPMNFWLYPAYTPEAGVNGSLSADGCGLMVRSSGGPICFFGEPYSPTTYTYKDPRGRVYIMSADGSLRTVTDLTGNTLTFTPNGITSSEGNLNIPFVRDLQGRITRITDTTGKVFLYNYDAAGNLASVNLPGITAPVTYTYDTGHLFLRAVDPRGNSEATTTYHPDGRMASFSDAAGNLTSYEYDLATNTTKTTNPDGGVSVMRYDTNGLVLSTTDPLGHTTKYTYDANRNKLTETNALGQTIRYTYDAKGNQTSMTDALGKSTRTTYNQYGGPVTSTDQLGNVRTALYDANFTPIALSDALGTFATYSVDRHGAPITYTDGNGATYRYTYDAYGNRLSRTDPLERTTTYTYDLMGRILTTTDPRGNVTRNTYDSLGHVLTVTDALNRVTRYEYDGNGNRTAQVDASNRRTTFAYDAANRMTKVTFPNNSSISYTYDFRGRTLTETDQAGHVTTNVYDKAGQLIEILHPDGAQVKLSYDAIGRVASVTDERGNVTSYEYDPSCGCRERVAKITDALGRVTTYAFDAAGRRTSFTDANNHKTTYGYDVRGRQTQIMYPDQTVIRNSYDGAGYRQTKTDEAGNVTRFLYDEAGELLSVTDALNNKTSYAYDVTGNPLTITDANNRITRFEYDRLNRVTKRTLPLGMFETLTYDPVGNLSNKVDFNGKRTTYTYDTLNRLLSKIPDSTLAEPTVRFTYTATGDRATMVDATGTTTYNYDDRHRLLSKTTPQGTLTYTYDAAGNISSLRSSNADGASINYAYDDVNRLSSVTDNRLNPGVTTYSYDAVGNLTAEAMPNGVRSVYTYDSINQLTALSHERNGTATAGYTYVLSPTGHRLSVNEQNGRTVNYGYDALLRLTSETIDGDPNGANGTINYAYDPVGNLLERNSTLASLPSTTSTYDANDRLTTDSYDANGNTKIANAATYVYDFENRIKSVNGGAVSFSYDGDGNRVAKAAGGVATKYLVDDRNPTTASNFTPASYQQVVEEVANGSVQRVYTYGNALISQQQLLNGNWTPSYYGRDGHGSVRMLTDNAGAVTDTYNYEAYGNLVSQVGTTPNNYLYSGEQFDSALGFYYQRARYYNQQRGRFMSMDTYQGKFTRPVTLHKYLYTNADPVNLIDPSGCFAAGEYALVQRRVSLPVAATLPPIGAAIACIFMRAASAVAGGTEPVPGNPCLLTKPPCPPCPAPPPPEIDRVPPSRRHHPCPGDHWHYYQYNQNPVTCQCFGPRRMFGGCCGAGDPNAPC